MRYNYLVRYLPTIICSVCQLKDHCELVSVQEAVFILIRQPPDLVHGGVRQLIFIQQVVPHQVPWHSTSLELQLVKISVVQPLPLRCEGEVTSSEWIILLVSPGDLWPVTSLYESLLS